jgi:hypothetical protein
MSAFGRDLLFLFVRYSYLQVSLPLFNTFLILHIIPSLCVITPPNPNPLSRRSALISTTSAITDIKNTGRFTFLDFYV